MTRRPYIPEGSWPRGLSRDEAAAYVGIGTTLFDEWAKDARRRIGRKITYNIGKRVLYDRFRLDEAINDQLDREELDKQTDDGNDAYSPARQAA
jgi:hypothetical protein